MIKFLTMATHKITYSGGQLTMLVVLRMLIGWHFLYEGVVKLWNPGWSARGFLLDSGGPMKGFFAALAANETVLGVVDFLNVWGLIFIGLGLLLGLFSRYAAIAGAVLLGFYYLSHPPLIGTTYALPSEGSYLFVNKNLIELFALGVISAFPTSTYIGLDRLLAKFRNRPVPEDQPEVVDSMRKKEKVVV